MSPDAEKFPGAGANAGGVRDGNRVLAFLLLPPPPLVAPRCRPGGGDARECADGAMDDEGCAWYDWKPSKERSGGPVFFYVGCVRGVVGGRRDAVGGGAAGQHVYELHMISRGVVFELQQQRERGLHRRASAFDSRRS